MGWLRPGHIRRGIGREEEKITGRGWGGVPSSLASSFPLESPRPGAWKSPFSSDVQGPLSHRLGKLGLEGGCLTIHSLARPHSLPVPILVSCSLPCGIPERVAGAILSMTG